MHVLYWVLLAVLAGVNLHALVALWAALTGHPAAASRQRAWALRCALSGLGAFILSAAVGGVLLASAFSVDAIEPPERAKHVASGISEAMNCFAFGGLGLGLPLVAALVLIGLARRAARRP
jgi:hypothetical protein